MEIFAAILSLVTGALSAIWILYTGQTDYAWVTALFVINGLLYHGLAKHRKDALSLISKLQGDPHQGRRAIDTAIPKP